MNTNTTVSARLATLDELVAHTLPNFLCPVPSRETLRDWFNAARIPRFKPNPIAKRGGGPVYFSVAAVEKFLRSRTTPKLEVCDGRRGRGAKRAIGKWIGIFVWTAVSVE